jgi:hypothetical protein
MSRTSFLGAAALGAAVMVGATSVTVSAQLSTQSPVTQSRDHDMDVTDQELNPCTAEPVTIQGHSTTRESSSPGFFRFQFHQSGKGVGLTTGAPYQYQDWTDSEVHSTTNTFTDRFTIRKHLIREGSPSVIKDDWFVRETFAIHVVNGITTVTMENFDAEPDCK